jgi:hypothetical protein
MGSFYQNLFFFTKIFNKKIGILVLLAQMKKIHYKDKQEQQTPIIGGTPPHIQNLNQ